MDQLIQELNQANHITVLTGAGVSTASGIPDFRSSNGIWTKDESREYFMSNQYFHLDPNDFWKKYKDIFQLKLLRNYKPNEVHSFIHSLEEKGKKVAVVTQNVDGLHQKAGSSNVIEYHGSLTTSTCPACGDSYDMDYVNNTVVPRCERETCGAILKPDIVLFGDAITEHDRAEAIIDQTDLLLVLGTSLLVMPFNFLPEYAYSRKIPTALINREETPKDRLFHYVIHDDLISTLQQIESQLTL